MSNKRLLSLCCRALGLLLLFLALFQLPDHVTVNDHDEGSQAAIEYWTTHGFAYGTDIVQNVGPLGFLNYRTIFTGDCDGTKLALNVLLTGLCVFLAWRRSRDLPIGAAILFLGALGLYAGEDAFLYVLMLLAVAHGLREPGPWPGLLVTALLALLSLSKGTCLFIALAGMGVLVAAALATRRYGRAAGLAAGYAGTFAALWLACGQSLAGLPGYFEAMASFSGGYNEAMTYYEPLVIRCYGLAAFLGLAALMAAKWLHGCRAARTAPARWLRLSLETLLEAFILFVVWKHGFVRADAHVDIFFQFVLAGLGWLVFRPQPEAEPGYAPWNRWKWGWVVAAGVFLAANLGIFYVGKLTPWTLVLRRGEQVRSRLAILLQPSAHWTRLEADLRKHVGEMALARTRALAGQTPVGYHGMYPAALVYNDLRYAPSPATISFAAWNAYSMARDRDFLADDARAPGTLLYDATTVDSRLAAQDDALAQLEILHRYALVDAEYGNLVLRRIPGRGALAFAPLGGEAHVALGEWIAVPDTAEPVWVRLALDEPLLGRLVATLYKPPRYQIELAFADGRVQTSKFMPRMARVGFLLNPVIEDNYAAVLARLRPANGAELPRVTRLRIVCDRFEALAARKLSVDWQAVKGLDLVQADEPGRFEPLLARFYAFQAVFDAAHPAPAPAKGHFRGRGVLPGARARRTVAGQAGRAHAPVLCLRHAAAELRVARSQRRRGRVRVVRARIGTGPPAPRAGDRSGDQGRRSGPASDGSGAARGPG